VVRCTNRISRLIVMLEVLLYIRRQHISRYALWASNGSWMVRTGNFYARKQNASRVFAIVWASVCLSVCLSVTLVNCIKTAQARITKSSLAAPRSLVYRGKISCHWVQEFTSNEGVEEGYPLKRRHFAVIGSNNVKTVADRCIHAAYHNKHWWQAFWIY